MKTPKSQVWLVFSVAASPGGLPATWGAIPSNAKVLVEQLPGECDCDPEDISAGVTKDPTLAANAPSDESPASRHESLSTDRLFDWIRIAICGQSK